MPFIAGSGNVNQIYLGALLELLLIVANIGTAVVIVPIMRRQFEALSIGYVAARLIECSFILVGIVSKETPEPRGNATERPAFYGEE